MRFFRKTSGAFTLVELLIVFGVIAVLMALLFPLFGKMREAALRAGCVKNLQTIGGALTLHALEHKGRLPGPSFAIVDLGKAYSIAGQLEGYLDSSKVDSIWECPANPALIARNKVARRNGATRHASYVTHTPYFGYTYSPPRPSPEPMLLTDIKELERAAQWMLEDVDYWNYPDVGRVGGNYPPVHREGRNRLYPDMTVEWFKVPPK